MAKNHQFELGLVVSPVLAAVAMCCYCSLYLGLKASPATYVSRRGQGQFPARLKIEQPNGSRHCPKLDPHAFPQAPRAQQTYDRCIERPSGQLSVACPYLLAGRALGHLLLPPERLQ